MGMLYHSLFVCFEDFIFHRLFSKRTFFSSWSPFSVRPYTILFSVFNSHCDSLSDFLTARTDRASRCISAKDGKIYTFCCSWRDMVPTSTGFFPSSSIQMGQKSWRPICLSGLEPSLLSPDRELFSLAVLALRALPDIVMSAYAYDASPFLS